MAEITSIQFFISGMLSQFPAASRAVISRSEGQHDLIEIYINSFDHDLLSESLSLPITVSFGSTDASRVMYGYVDTPSPQGSRSSRVEPSSIFALGASSLLRDAHPRVWKNTNPSVIAHDILDPAQFGLVIDAYAYNIDNFSQGSDESDWRTLMRLARTIGYSLVADNTVIQLIDPRRELARTSTTFSFILPSRDKVQAATATEFISEMTATPHGSDFKNYTMTGVDGLGQTFTYQTSWDPSFGDNTPTVSALHQSRFDSLFAAQVEGSRVASMTRWTMRATMSCHGNADLQPGRYINISDPKGPSNGLWYVTDVKHMISVKPASYECIVSMCKEHLPSRRPFQVPRVRTVYSDSAVLTKTNVWRSPQKVSVTM